MTVAAKRIDHEGGAGTAKPVRSRSGGNPWRRVWQVPLLIGGLVLFGVGVRALVKVVRPVPFELQVRGVRELLAGEQYGKAVEQINILANYYKEPAQEGQLQLLAGDAHFQWQQNQPAPVKENYQRVLNHYEKAVQLGVEPDAVMNERWGEAALAVGNTKLAVEKLEAAITGNGGLLGAHARELVAAYLADGQRDKAQEMLSRYLEVIQRKPKGATEGNDPGATAAAEGVPDYAALDNRVWALCMQIEVALGAPGGAGADGGASLARVVQMAKAALETIPERDPAARLLTWIGRAELERGEVDLAAKDLTEARARFVARPLDDGRAAILLAKIAESKSDWKGALELYADAVRAHAGTVVWAAARLGRAEMTLRDGTGVANGATGKPWLNEQLLDDYHFAIEAVNDKTLVTPPELVDRDSLRTDLVADYQRASDSGRLEEALTFVALEKEMGTTGPTGVEDEAIALRLASTEERRGAEMMAAAEKISTEGSDKAKRTAAETAAREMFAKAAADYQRHAKLTTMKDEMSGNSLWKAAGLWDMAGFPVKAVDAFEQFTVQRPRDPRVPEGLLTMGRLYQSMGIPEKAIPVYQRNIKENPKTIATYRSAVNLAQCFMALEDKAVAGKEGDAARQDAFGKAEDALLTLVQKNSDLLPTASEFRASVFLLGDLYYRNGKWADAILRLEEAAARYPDDRAELPRGLFLLGESYRKSAEDIGAALAGDPAISGRAALEAARLERLDLAGKSFGKVVAMLDADGGAGAEGGAGALSPLEQDYLRNSYLNRASCYYDRGEYTNAIKLYDEAATRFSEETLAVRAYVQIVNAYVALHQPAQANSAAERGAWLLKKLPKDAFDGDSMGRDAYERLFSVLHY